MTTATRAPAAAQRRTVGRRRSGRAAGLEGYQRWLQAQGLSANTIAARVYFADRWRTIWGTFDVPADEAATWLADYDGWSRRTYLANLRSLYDWLRETGEVPVSPVQRYRTPRKPPPRSNPLDDLQAQRALSAAEGDLRAWLTLALYAGLRTHEIAKIRGEDVTENQLFVIGKGGVHAALPTHPAIWELARDYPRHGWWFPSPHRDREHIHANGIGTKIRAHFRALGIDQGALHRCRHTYATSLSRAGVQPRVIQDLMRHGSLETTMHYLAVSDPERAAAVRTLAFVNNGSSE